MKTAILSILALASTKLALASTVAYLPVSDGSVYSSGATTTSAYVLADTNIDGDLQFASANFVPYKSIQLELNPYGEPLWGPLVQVYGYDHAAGHLIGSDYNAGTYLGTLTLPANLGFGQQVFFDVTQFVDSTTGPYFGFDLSANGTDVFSSSAYNYGTPPELVASTIPEPSTYAAILGASVLGFVGFRRFKSAKVSA